MWDLNEVFGKWVKTSQVLSKSYWNWKVVEKTYMKKIFGSECQIFCLSFWGWHKFTFLEKGFLDFL